MLTIITALIAYTLLLTIGIQRQQRHIRRLNALLVDMAVEARHKEKAAHRRGWNEALARAYPYGVIPERVKCPDEDKMRAIS
jgi:hypothetical protein